MHSLLRCILFINIKAKYGLSVFLKEKRFFSLPLLFFLLCYLHETSHLIYVFKVTVVNLKAIFRMKFCLAPGMILRFLKDVYKLAHAETLIVRLFYVIFHFYLQGAQTFLAFFDIYSYS